MLKTISPLATTVAVLMIALVASGPTSGQDIEQLKQAKDNPGLLRLLRHHDGKFRSSAAVALSGTIREVTDSRELARYTLPLVDVTLRDPYSTVREYAGRALQHCLQNIDDVSILRGSVPPLVDALNAAEVDEKRRRYCAVQLSRVIAKIEHEPLLVQSIPNLITATLDDPSPEVREYAGRALKSALPRIRDTELLHAGTVRLAETLSHDDVNRRRYAAVLLSWLIPKLEQDDTLRTVAAKIALAAKEDQNEVVREYAGRADRYIGRRLSDAKSKEL